MNKIRKFENFHIFLWLLKDTSWLMELRALGIFMIFPTLGFAFYITWRTYKNTAEFLPNLAVIFWVCANSYWMITEFFGMESELKIYALIPFSLGLACIVTYYAKLLYPKTFR